MVRLWIEIVESTLTAGVMTASSLADGTTPPAQVEPECQLPPPAFAVMISARLAEAHKAKLRTIKGIIICFVFICFRGLALEEAIMASRNKRDWPINMGALFQVSAWVPDSGC